MIYGYLDAENGNGYTIPEQKNRKFKLTVSSLDAEFGRFFYFKTKEEMECFASKFHIYICIGEELENNSCFRWWYIQPRT